MTANTSRRNGYSAMPMGGATQGGTTRDGKDKSIITAVVEEAFEPLHTGKSLVFTIAPNGKVWGKRLDLVSTKRDIEIEIFAPVDGGYFLYRQDKRGNRESIVFGFGNSLTVEQQKKINLILAQKEKIYCLLGTLQVQFYSGMYFHKYASPRDHNACTWSHDPFYGVRVVEVGSCEGKSVTGLHTISYDHSRFVFILKSTKNIWEKKSFVEAHACGRHCSEQWESGESLITLEHNGGQQSPRFECTLVRAKNRMFEFGFHPTYGTTNAKLSKLYQPSLRVMSGQYDFFDTHEIDDALLLLETEYRSNDEIIPHWTLAVAQNRLARNLVRLSSNNPDLFRPLFSHVRSGC